MLRIAFHTLGCKVNQYETEKIAEGFTSTGFKVVDFNKLADVYIVNSCTVTKTADAKTRQAVRCALNRNPKAAVILTGCYAEAFPSEAQALKSVTAVIGNRDKAQIVEKVQELLSITSATGHQKSRRSDYPWGKAENEYTIRDIQSRTRALLKVQDGCNQFCSYCAVPFARSEMWCKPFDEVINEAESLAHRGHKEVVLTGIRLGLYKNSTSDLSDLIERMSRIEQVERIRLSSIEITDIPENLLDLMSAEKKVCRHLHIPLQSGDDEILRRMNRPYSSSEFREFVNTARSKVPDIGITTDVMVGFPGETESQFCNTYNMLEEIKFSRAHIFKYSARPGTQAAKMLDDVPVIEKKKRSACLAELSAKNAKSFAESLVGRETHVLVEGKSVGGRVRSGLTDNYVRIFFEAGPETVGNIVPVYVTGFHDDEVWGEIVSGLN